MAFFCPEASLPDVESSDESEDEFSDADGFSAFEVPSFDDESLL